MSAAESFEESIIGDLVWGARRGHAFMFIKSYFDESYDNNLLCVAGYSFTHRSATLFDRDWRRMLFRNKKLPYFRMSACNAKQEPFERLSEVECIAVETEAISLIRKYAVNGYAITIDTKAFARIARQTNIRMTAYELCSWFCLIGCRAELSKRYNTISMSFIFEAGFKDQSSANKMMNRLFKEPVLRERYGYKGHYFLDKVESRPTQAADLLAWQWYKDCTRRSNGLNKPRGDLEALITGGPPHSVLHLEESKISELAEIVSRDLLPSGRRSS